jgi:hypothetical protein
MGKEKIFKIIFRKWFPNQFWHYFQLIFHKKTSFLRPSSFLILGKVLLSLSICFPLLPFCLLAFWLFSKGVGWHSSEHPPAAAFSPILMQFVGDSGISIWNWKNEKFRREHFTAKNGILGQI